MNDTEYSGFPALSPVPLGGSETQTVNARELHAFLGVGRIFAAWLPDRIDQYGFTENVDFVVFSETGNNPSGGRPTKEYAISIDMAKELSMVERTEKGKQARRYFIDCERRAKSGPAIDVRSVPQLQTIALQLIEVNKEQSEQIAAMTPKVEAMALLEASEGSVGPRLAAKMLGIAEKRFTAWLQTNRWAFRQNGIGPLQAYVDKRDAGYLEHRPHTFYDQGRGEERTIAQLMITPKGLAKLATIFATAGKAA